MTHVPVMLKEVLQYLAPADNKIYVDGTFGRGGYSRAVLNAADCRVFAIDRDPTAKFFAEKMKNEFGDRFDFSEGCFGAMQEILEQRGILRVDGIMLDIGVSSPQIDDAERGFSFQKDGPLDMRMGNGGITAEEIVNSCTEEELADILYRFGDEPKSRKIAKSIVQERQIKRITTTLELRDIIHRALKCGYKKTDPATRSFQAIRIAVNDELGELERALAAAASMLSASGRMVIVSFHSLEDGIVKEWIKNNTARHQHVNKYRPENITSDNSPFRLLHKSAISVSEQEADENPRARSARLRAVERAYV